MDTNFLELSKPFFAKYDSEEIKLSGNDDRNGFIIYSKEKVDCKENGKNKYSDIYPFYENYIEENSSETNLFRYYYYRKRGENGIHITVVMMNPAFADSEEDDDTIKNILKYLENKPQYASFDIVNLYPVRMPKSLSLPKLNKKIEKYFKSINKNYQQTIVNYLENINESDNIKIVAAWGSKYHKKAIKLFRDKNIDFYSYAEINSNGSPRHFSNIVYYREGRYDDFKKYELKSI